MVRQIMEKRYEYNVNVHQLFVDFRQAYDSVKRNKLYQTMVDMEFPTKLIGLIQITLRNTRGKVKIEGNLTRKFEINQGLRQGDVLSTMLFNVVLERVMRKKQVNKQVGILFNRISQNLAYANDVDMISRRLKNLDESLERLEMEAEKVGLKVNCAKTQYLFSSRKSMTGNDKFIELNGSKYEISDKF
ncbi:hypothetical protein J437_LFUL003714 [Ladona fulva]|uniref:Reverse transcriptase domain-containing protein n=1 Tax=Ladona fulva TaxID=123851 RepID=A0A8K0JWW3_LADFU|nr:hypothetical protein J437_LFUL003714 [Ladona fulva]